MMIRRRVLPVLAGMFVLLLPAAGLSAGSAQAVAGSAPGWRLFTQIGPANSSSGSSIFAVTSTRDAWSVWAGPRDTAWLEHWAGRAWRRVAVPAKVTKVLVASDAIGAASANELWVFAPGKAAHWNGKHWGVMKLPSWMGVDVPVYVDVNRICDFGPSDVWAFFTDFGSAPPSVPIAARYDGHHWIKVRMPAMAEIATGFGPGDIWALADTVTSDQGDLLLHWNGKSWVKLLSPKPSGVPAHYRAQLAGFTVTGPNDVWLRQDIAKGVDGGFRVEFLLHWNGRTWTRVRYRYSPEDIAAMTGDGHGGLWISEFSETKIEVNYLVHYNAGKWSRQVVPAPKNTQVETLLTINRIPGTESVWATGALIVPQPKYVVRGTIWKFGA